MSPIMELIKTLERPTSLWALADIERAQAADKAHADLQRLVEWCKNHKNSHIDYCGYYDQKACICGWAEIQFLLGDGSE